MRGGGTRDKKVRIVTRLRFVEGFGTRRRKKRGGAKLIAFRIRRSVE
jgi:hypothetical protein